MKLIHILKSSTHVIPLDGAAALSPTAFRTLFKKKKGLLAHDGFAWHLTVTGEGKYTGHVFGLVLEPEEIDAAIAALHQHKHRILHEDPASLVQAAPLPIGSE